MSLFFCAWDRDDGPCSLMVDAKDEEQAREMARHFSGEGDPKRCLKWEPGIFAVEVIEEDADEEDEDGGAVLTLVPFAAVADAIVALEEAGDGAERAALVDAPACGAEAEDDEGNTWRCVMVEGHEGAHRSSDGERWSD